MLFLRNNSNLTHSQAGFPPILDLLPGLNLSPFLTGPTHKTSRNETFAVPAGEGWTDHSYTLRFVIPGVERTDFALTFQGNRLILRGERRKPEQLQSGDFDFAMEYGRFETSVELPQGLDLKRMNASFHHGLLDVQIPTLDEMKARAVPIHYEMDVLATASVA